MLWWHSNRRHKKLRAAVDDDANEFIELAFRIVVARINVSKKACKSGGVDQLGLAGIASNLEENQHVSQ